MTKRMVAAFIKSETVLVCAWFLAAISAFAIPPDKEYIGYINTDTIFLLFSLMAIVSGLKSSNFLSRVGAFLISKVKTKRQIEAILIMLCFFSSMIITNDVSLITFVPLSIEVLRTSKMENRIIPVITAQTIAANLGSMSTPVGNPQNIYIYSSYSLSVTDFISVMLPYTSLSFLLLAAFVFTGKNVRVKKDGMPKTEDINIKSTVFYMSLFAVCILSVIRILPDAASFLIVLVFMLIFDRKNIRKVDYSLLLTFIGFFIFTGNIGRMEFFSGFLKSAINGKEVITSVIASQVISNVPAAILLSKFTQNWGALMAGVNIGGLGTLIASMASLISYKYISVEYPEKRLKYLIYFTVINIIFLAALMALYFILHLSGPI